MQSSVCVLDALLLLKYKQEVFRFTFALPKGNWIFQIKMIKSGEFLVFGRWCGLSASLEECGALDNSRVKPSEGLRILMGYSLYWTKPIKAWNCFSIELQICWCLEYRCAEGLLYICLLKGKHEIISLMLSEQELSCSKTLKEHLVFCQTALSSSF